MMPPPGPWRYCWWLKLKWEWHWDWELWWGKYVSGVDFSNEGCDGSSLHLGCCHCFHRSPACARCDETPRPGTAFCEATRTKHKDTVGHLMHGTQDGEDLYEHLSCVHMRTYLMHVNCMHAHLSGGILWEDQTGELTLPCTASRAHSSGISPTGGEGTNGKTIMI